MSDQTQTPPLGDDENPKPASPSEVVKKVIEVLRTDEMRAVTPDALPEPIPLPKAKPVPEPTKPTPEPAKPTTPKPVTLSAKPSKELTSSKTQPVPALDIPPAPWTLEQFLNGEIDLDFELNRRFPNMPMMSTVQFRALGTKAERRVATLGTQDNSASLVVDVDIASKNTQFSFVLGNMLSLRFILDEASGVSDADRQRWLELMKRDSGGLGFLWGASRWGKDYVVCVNRRTYANFFAFSPQRFEAAVRLTPPVMKQFLAWLADAWKPVEPPANPEAPILTW
jgi:hypothetical protein